MNESSKNRLVEIISIAQTLKWIFPKDKTYFNPSYPLMQLSEVEKCMLAMTDDFELERMRKWQRETLLKQKTVEKEGSLK